MPARLKLGIGISVILVVLAWLIASGFQEGKTYYHTVDEVVLGRTPRPEARLKVSGEVRDGSIARRADGLHFTLEENGQSLAVVYAGLDPVPDTFKDRAKAVVEGRLQPDGTLRADRIQAKCASKYEAMYDDLAAEPQAAAQPASSPRGEGAAP